MTLRLLANEWFFSFSNRDIQEIVRIYVSDKIRIILVKGDDIFFFLNNICYKKILLQVRLSVLYCCILIP